MIRAGDNNPPKHSSVEPYFNARSHQTGYAGPGREAPPPIDINEVRIGYFGPSTPSHPEGGDMWCAARMAIEEANETGGYKGLPFRLVADWSDNPWGSGVTAVTRMVYSHKVWAIIGGIDGPSTHLAEQVVAKARLTLLSPASTDKTVNLANVPWMFSCLPGDHLQAPILARVIASHVRHKPFLLVSAVDHDSHLFTRELIKSLTRNKLVPSCHLEFDPKQKNNSGLVDKMINAKAHTLVLIADARRSAKLICSVREKGFKGAIFGGPDFGQRHFLDAAGKAAEGVIFPLLYTNEKRSDPFEKKFISRFKRRPDYLATHTYDAVHLLIAAIHEAGLNRARIGDAVRKLSGWHGVTGDIIWDPLGANVRPVGLGIIQDGYVRPFQQNGVHCTPYLCPLPSVSVIIWSAAMFSNTSVPPPILRTSIRSTLLRFPNPKCNRVP
jgi:branched-chain amino acid transport system substrate-binding protein